MARNGTGDALRVSGLFKTYGTTRIVEDMSFSVGRGEVFGLIGPNGAGKTTTIRMTLRIIQPDAGDVLMFGKPFDEDAWSRVGYLPEERGLYRSARVFDVLVYLGQLKGLSAADAKRRAGETLELIGMTGHAHKKVSELSRGMGQLIQFGSTVVHNPELVILDEPFSGLDPVNTEKLKELVLGLQKQGMAVIFSTHQMNNVEELCDRVLMINHGRAVLYGPVKEVKERYRKNSLILSWNGPRERVRGVSRWEPRGEFWEAYLKDGVAPESVLVDMVQLGGAIRHFEPSMPTLHEVFLRVARDGARAP
ncbi:MAG: ATP-binding cassette domain-containing protein [SAR202 cluster bacterium]|nr:ATP-binding cassette domain-containing protein [SAR202 cluster bacterium]